MTQADKKVVIQVLNGIIDYELENGSEVLARTFANLGESLDLASEEMVADTSAYQIGERIADEYISYAAGDGCDK